ncbi:MAG: galactokinase family protein [bacterium]
MIDFASRLRETGMSEHEVLSKAHMYERCVLGLATLDPAPVSTQEPTAFFVPGRIEVLGKHTDYAGGRSLLCAMERGFAVLALPRDDQRVRAIAVSTGEIRNIACDDDAEIAPGDWSAYVRTVSRRIMRDFPTASRGVDLAFDSDLPAASGMSSSSAMVVALFLALSAANDLESDETYRRIITSREVLGNYLGAVENGRDFGAFAGGGGVGTLGGSQDQTAILCCRSGVLSGYSFCPVRAEGEIPFPPDRVFVVAYSGVAAEKTANALLKYNEASLAVVEILRQWNVATKRHDASLADAVVSGTAAPFVIRDILGDSTSPDFTPQRLLDRFEQFVTESFDIIPRTVAAFNRGDLAAVGRAVDRSQRGVETLLGNQVPETVTLVLLARAFGADASSAFGAGFGGSVWALVAADGAEQFAARWRDAYAHDFPQHVPNADFIITRPGPGAMRM